MNLKDTIQDLLQRLNVVEEKIKAKEDAKIKKATGIALNELLARKK